ncbi:MAG: hypothetical protein AB1486_32935 [Planctomycetota bacterium]
MSGVPRGVPAYRGKYASLAVLMRLVEHRSTSMTFAYAQITQQDVVGPYPAAQQKARRANATLQLPPGFAATRLSPGLISTGSSIRPSCVASGAQERLREDMIELD